jgi:hypothetical protein
MAAGTWRNGINGTPTREELTIPAHGQDCPPYTGAGTVPAVAPPGSASAQKDSNQPLRADAGRAASLPEVQPWVIVE